MHEHGRSGVFGGSPWNHLIAHGQVVGRNTVRRLPKELLVPAIALPAVPLVLGFAEGDLLGGALAAAEVAVIVAAAFTTVVGGAHLGRVRRRAARDRQGGHRGTWRVRLTNESSVGVELVGLGTTRGALLIDAPSFDLTIDSHRLTVAPVGLTRRVGGYQAVTFTWDEIAEVRRRESVYRVGSRLSPLPLARIEFVIVGSRVDEMHRPSSDEEAAVEQWAPAERAQDDAETLALAREEHGQDYRLGTMPFSLLVDDPDSLIALAGRYARGVLPN